MNFDRIILFVYNKISIIKKYRLKKLNKYLETIGIESLMKNIEQLTQDPIIRTIIKNNDKLYNDHLKNFKNVMEANFDSEKLSNFYYNSEWVKVNRVNFNPFSSNIGTYNYLNNKLRFNEKSINHEFFHLSSTNYDSIYISSGFVINIDDIGLGNALNEGYTDLLTNRYFGEDIDDYYCIEAKYASNLEKIIGKEIMEDLYLKGDFFGLIRELKKYYDINEIEKFLIDFDAISLYRNNYLSNEEASIINNISEDCICFLIKGFCKVIKKDSYSIEIKIQEIIDYYNNINYTYNFFNNDFEINIDRINKIIHENLSNEINIKVNTELYNIKNK